MKFFPKSEKTQKLKTCRTSQSFVILGSLLHAMAMRLYRTLCVLVWYTLVYTVQSVILTRYGWCIFVLAEAVDGASPTDRIKSTALIFGHVFAHNSHLCKRG